MNIYIITENVYYVNEKTQKAQKESVILVSGKKCER